MNFFKKIWLALKEIWFFCTINDDLTSCEEQNQRLKQELEKMRQTLNHEREKTTEYTNHLQELLEKYDTLKEEVELLIETKEKLENDLTKYEEIKRIVGSDILDELIEKTNLGCE